MALDIEEGGNKPRNRAASESSGKETDYHPRAWEEMQPRCHVDPSSVRLILDF